jgi:hypothetical protein
MQMTSKSLELPAAAALVLAAFVAVWLGLPGPGIPRAPGPVRPLNPAWATVLSPDQAADVVHQCTRATPSKIDGTWTPTPAQIRALERALALVLPQADEYYRQYAGVVVHGKRIIYVNGFHRGYLEDLKRFGGDTAMWRRQALDICDGGRAFFGVEFDPATGKIRNLEFNAYA